MKNILFVCDSFLQGGLETRIIEEVKFYKTLNINVYLACEKFSNNNKSYFKDILHLTSLPQTDINVKDIIENRNAISRFCKEHSIEYLECQPFWCIIPATLAAEKNKLPINYTLHGVGSGNFTNPRFLESTMLVYLCLKYGFDKTFAVAEYLTDLYSFIFPKAKIFRNGISLKKEIPEYSPSEHGRIAIASRLDSIKTPLIIDFLELLKKTPPPDDSCGRYLRRRRCVRGSL